MQLAILLSNSIFAALLLLYIIHKTETAPCDTKWIRLVYMLSCGKKKRESLSVRNESFSEPLPTDIYGALQYFKERDPMNPLFNEDGKLLTEILEDHNHFTGRKNKYGGYHVSKVVSKNTNYVDKKIKKSILMKKIINTSKHQNSLGLPGFPDQWDMNEIFEQKINENHRREIDRLLQECCTTAHESSCNGETFRGACK